MMMRTIVAGCAFPSPGRCCRPFWHLQNLRIREYMVIGYEADE